MTPEEFKNKMLEISTSREWDTEILHEQADELMCELLSSLGYGEGILIFTEMNKWYA